MRGLVVVVVWIVANGNDDGRGTDEAGDLVDVTVGVVASDLAAGEPQDFFRAEVVAEIPFDVVLRELRIAVGIEQAGFGREDAAAAVAVDRTPFEDDAGDEAAAILQLGDAARDLIIEIERRIFAAPGVVVPVDEGSGFRLSAFGFCIGCRLLSSFTSAWSRRPKRA